MRKEIVRNQVRCGGSPEMISALSGRLYGIALSISAVVALALIFGGCAISDNGGAAVKSDSPRMTVSGTLPGSEYVGKTWEHVQFDAESKPIATINVLSVHMDEGMSYLGAGIGIDGSMLITAEIDLNTFEETVVDFPDWRLVDENVEPMRR